MLAHKNTHTRVPSYKHPKYSHVVMQFIFDLEGVGDTVITIRGLEDSRTPDGVLNVTCHTGATGRLDSCSNGVSAKCDATVVLSFCTVVAGITRIVRYTMLLFIPQLLF
jgi:hypothetical protein